MSIALSADGRRAERRALMSAVAVAVATSVHHAYGAIIYHTPWRYDAVAVSAGTIALLLAAVGIYSVMSYTVAQRIHEIGVRAALGANRRDILRLIVFHALRLTVVGAVIGIAASLWLTGLIRTQLFGVSPSDPLTFGVAPLVLVAIALLAAFVPALRASRVDPLVALRDE